MGVDPWGSSSAYASRYTRPLIAYTSSTRGPAHSITLAPKIKIDWWLWPPGSPLYNLRDPVTSSYRVFHGRGVPFACVGTHWAYEQNLKFWKMVFSVNFPVRLTWVISNNYCYLPIPHTGHLKGRTNTFPLQTRLWRFKFPICLNSVIIKNVLIVQYMADLVIFYYKSTVSNLSHSLAYRTCKVSRQCATFDV